MTPFGFQFYQTHSLNASPAEAKRVALISCRRTMKATAAALGALAAIAVAFMMAAAPGHALTCSDVDMCLAPCVPYLTGQQAAPTAACCDGVKRLKTIGTTTAERQFACNCVKLAAAHIPGIKNEAVVSLPAQCGTPLPFPISLDFDCTKIPI